jgi:hypothetical protein
MTTADYRVLASNLSNAIRDSSDIPTWEEARYNDIPNWQRTILSRVLAVISDRPIDYLTTTWNEETGLRLVVFCGGLILDLRATKTESREYLVASVRVVSQESVRAVEVDSVAVVPFEEADWPNRIEIKLDFGDSEMALPLDRHASNANRRSLANFYPSIFERMAKTPARD